MGLFMDHGRLQLLPSLLLPLSQHSLVQSSGACPGEGGKAQIWVKPQGKGVLLRPPSLQQGFQLLQGEMGSWGASGRGKGAGCSLTLCAMGSCTGKP